MTYLLMTLFAAGAVVLDQWTKYLTVANISLYSRVPFWDGLFHFTYVQNFGAAFSSLQGMRWLFVAIFVVLTVLLSYLPRRLRMDTVSCQLINVLYWTIFIIFIISLLVIASYQDMAQPEPEPPVSISVFRPFEAATDVELSRDTTPFGSRLSCYLYTEDDRISYFVYESSYDWVLDAVWNQELKNAANTESCTEAWAAMDAFRKDSGRYVVHYGNKILILNPGPRPLNQDQIDTIIAALKEG